MRLIYLSASKLPSAAANAVHVAQMCEAFAGLGCAVRLHGLHGDGGSPTVHYGLRQRFAIRLEGKLRHQLWLAALRLRRGSGRDRTIYFGRRLISLARLAAAGYPVGVELHHPPRTARQAAALAQLVAAPRFLGLVVISQQLRAELLRRLPQLAPDRVLVAHDGVRGDQLRAPALQHQQPLRAVYCGSFHRGKGVETIIRAAALVPEVRFELIGGDAAQVDAVRAQAPANLTCLGRLSHEQTQRQLPGYDLALAPYGSIVHGAQTPKHENLADWMSPLKIFEAMGAGLPIVTSDLPVLREILTPGESALMTAPGDAEALAAAVRRLADDPQLRLRLASTAQARLRDHTWEQRAAQILAFLSASLAARGSD